MYQREHMFELFVQKSEKIRISRFNEWLTRVRSGKFKIEQANTIEEIQNGTYKMISMLEALSDFDQIELDNKTEN